MNATLQHAGVGLAALVIGLAGAPSFDEESEPPPRYWLDTPDGRVEIEVDRPLEVGGVEVTLRLRPTRAFTLGEFRFEYPTDCTFGYDDEDGLLSWSFESTSCDVTVQRFARGLEVAELVEGMPDQLRAVWGDAFQGAEGRELEIGGRTLVGFSAEIAYEGYGFHLDTYGIDTAGTDYALLFRYPSEPTETEAAEWNAFRDAVVGSFEFID